MNRKSKLLMTLMVVLSCAIMQAGYLFLDGSGKTSQIPYFLKGIYISAFYKADSAITFYDDVYMATGKHITGDTDIDSAISLKHPAVTVSAPISVSTQAISLVNNAVSPATVTAIDIGALANTDTVVPTSKAVTTKLADYITKATLTEQGDIMYASGASTPAPLAHGTAGQILRSGGHGANPAWTTPTYPNVGTAGKVLIGDGTNIVLSTPTFPNASATARKMIVSDGTNWTASTELWPIATTSGNILVADGTNWTTSAPSLAKIGVGSARYQLPVTGATPFTPTWTTATGTGAPVLATSPTFTTQTSLTNTSGTLTNYVYSTTSIAGDSVWHRVLSWPASNVGQINGRLTVKGYSSSAYFSWVFDFSMIGTYVGIIKVYDANGSSSTVMPKVRISYLTDYYFEIQGDNASTNTITSMTWAGTGATPVEFTAADTGGAETMVFEIIMNSNNYFERTYISGTYIQGYTNSASNIAKNLTLGVGTAGTDYVLAFNGDTNDGTITYMEDEDRFDFDNDIYVTDDVSANTFTDHTPFYAGDALAEIKKIKGENGHIDHATLPTFAQRQIVEPIYEGRIIKDEEGNDKTERVKIDERTIPGRNLGAMISILTVAVQQLTKENEELKARLDKMENQFKSGVISNPVSK